MNCLRERLLNTLRPWCIDSISHDKEDIEISGWSVSGNSPRSELTVSSEQASMVDSAFDIYRPDLEKIFPYWPEAPTSGFKCKFKISPKNHEHMIKFSYGEKTDIPFDKLHFYAYPLNDFNAVPSPNDRYRVHGADSLSSFLLEGFSTYHKIDYIIKSLKFFHEEKCPKILDWGCGCGRVSRYFNTNKVDLWGADIDQANLRWCAENLNIETISINSRPEKKIPQDFFDIIFGISVMTHLDQNLQIEWIDELASSLKKGGYLLLTFHGASSALRGISEDGFQELLCKGFYDYGENFILKGSVPENRDYRDTYNTLGQIAKKWTKYLKITKYFDSIIGNHQDLVVLQKI